MLRVALAGLAVAESTNSSNTPTCSVNGAAGGRVVTFSDGTYQRCMAVITPSSALKPMPILWWFHGAGGNAAHCGNMRDMLSLAETTGFAFVCGEATQNVFGHGGEWNIPAKITDKTGTPCDKSDSVEVTYMKNAIAQFAQSPDVYDISRIFTAGCSMGSAFSGYIGNCLKTWSPQQISAFATHSTGLKKKGDGVRLPENWGECNGCQWWPFAPVKYTDKLGLKACVFDNTGDGDFYTTSKYLAQEWPKLGNPSESHFASGGHCQNIPYASIVKCLGIKDSSPRPGPSPGPSPAPTPRPHPSPTPRPSPSPGPSPSPSAPPAACQKCFLDGCPHLHKAASSACNTCVQKHKSSCARSCVPYPFQRVTSWFCDVSELQFV